MTEEEFEDKFCDIRGKGIGRDTGLVLTDLMYLCTTYIASKIEEKKKPVKKKEKVYADCGNDNINYMCDGCECWKRTRENCS